MFWCTICKCNVEESHVHDGLRTSVTYDEVKANEAQIEYCKKNSVPHFAPTGNCWCCGNNIFKERGVSVEEAGRELITGCPFCHRSYCD
jgi:hypothetical protein